MPNRIPPGSRTPFGDLLYRYRRALGISQRELAERVQHNWRDRPWPNTERASDTINENSIQGWERKATPGKDPTRPYRSSAIAVAIALDLVPGSSEFEIFVETARRAGPSQLTTAARQPVAASQRSVFTSAGREAALARLTRAITTVTSGQPDVVLVRGGGGIGKTATIAHACRESMIHDATGIVVIWVECPRLPRDTDDNTLFPAIIDLLTGGADTASPRIVLTADNRARLVRNRFTAIDTLLRHAPSLVDTMIPIGVLQERLTGADGATTRRLLEERAPAGAQQPGTGAFASFLAGYARHHPVVLVIDDLQWAQPAMLERLVELAQRLRERPAPVGLLCTVRTGADLRPDTRSAMLQLTRLYDDASIDLSTVLDDAAALAFVDAYAREMLDTVDDRFVEQVWARTGGLPLAVKGLFDHFTRDGVIAGHDGHLSLTQQPNWSLVPENVEAMFEERLGNLSPDERALMRCAAMLGPVFIADVLQAVLGWDDDRLIATIADRLTRHHHLLIETGTALIAEREVVQYRFEHVMLFDIVRGGIDALERRRLHRRIAEALIDVFGEGDHEMAADIAWHYEEANDRHRAGIFYKHAGDFTLGRHVLANVTSDFAVRRDRFTGGIGYFEKAFQLLDERHQPDLRCSVALGLANTSRAIPDLARARRLGQEALEIALAHNLSHMEGHALATIAMMEYDAGEMEAALGKLVRAGSLLRDHGDDRSCGRILALTSHVCYGLKRYQHGIEVAREAQVLARRFADDMVLNEALVAEANCLVDLGQFPTAVQAYQRLIERTTSVHQSRMRCVALVNLALCALECGSWADSAAALDTADALIRDAVVPRLEGVVATYRALLAEEQGDDDTADTAFARAHGMRQAHGQVALAMDGLAGRLRIACRRGSDEIAALYDDLASRIEARGLTGIEFPVRAWLALLDGAHALDRPGDTARWGEEARAFLHRQAATIDDPDLRHTYLIQSPTFRRLLTMIGDIDMLARGESTGR